jgi:hypothetical protein
MLFMHVRKTGGTSLTRLLSDRFAARDCLALYHRAMPRERYLDEFRYVTGHVDISFLERFRHPPYLVTCLRDPIDRALSVYSYYRWFPPEEYGVLKPELDPPTYERRIAVMRLARERPLGELLRRAPGLAPEHFGNVQTRVFCGSRAEGGEEDLGEAAAGLERCDFVALTERLEESAFWLARRLGWRELGPLPRANVSTEPLSRDQLSTETLDALHDLTALDRRLYKHATDRFERQTTQWSRASDARDESASFPDASEVGDLSFGEAIQGGGWAGRERIDGEPWFAWLGYTQRAWVDLRPSPVADRLVVEIPHVLQPAILDTLRITVNGELVSHSFSTPDSTLIATAPLPPETLRAVDGEVRVQLEVGRTARPCDFNPKSSDSRELAIAVRRVAFLPASP